MKLEKRIYVQNLVTQVKLFHLMNTTVTLFNSDYKNIHLNLMPATSLTLKQEQPKTVKFVDKERLTQLTFKTQHTWLATEHYSSALTSVGFFLKLGFTSPCVLPFKVSDDDLSQKQKHAYCSVKNVPLLLY